ncbi:hypothetical protein D3C77_425290 [compost metagenome]
MTAGADVEVLLTTTLGAVTELIKCHGFDHLGRRRLITQQVGGHGGQVGVLEVLGAVVHHREHLVEHAALGTHAVFEESGQVGRGPATLSQILGQQAGGQVAVEQATGQAFVLLQRADTVARRMAFTAVAEHFDHVLAALPRWAFALGTLQLDAFAVEHVPARQAHAHVERKAQAGLGRRTMNRGHTHHVRMDGIGILACDQVVGGIGHCRVEIGPVLAFALGQGGEELVSAVAADAKFCVRGDVTAPDRAER